jgi:hypothetical protein
MNSGSVPTSHGAESFAFATPNQGRSALENPCRIDSSTIVATMGRIIAMSERLFPGPVNVEYSFDPENPSDEYLVFEVVAHGEYKDYCNREFEWHEEVERIVPGTIGKLRLSVMPQR